MTPNRLKFQELPCLSSKDTLSGGKENKSVWILVKLNVFLNRQLFFLLRRVTNCTVMRQHPCEVQHLEGTRMEWVMWRLASKKRQTAQYFKSGNITDHCQLKKTSRMTLDAADKFLLIMLATCHNIVCYVSEINVPAIRH